MADLRAKVAKLLRIAEDQAGLPEGDAARKQAERIAEAAAIDLEEVHDEEKPITSEVLWVDTMPCAWAEMLAVVLVRLVYGGSVVPMRDDRSWSLHVVDAKDPTALARHFNHLSEILDLLVEAWRADVGEGDEPSFRLGAMTALTELLYEALGERVPEQDEMPYAAAMLAASPTEDGDAKIMEGDAENALERRGGIGELGRTGGAGETIVVQPDWRDFDAGRRYVFREVDAEYVLLEEVPDRESQEDSEGRPSD